MEDLALTVSLILLAILVGAFCYGGFIVTKTKPFLLVERLFLAAAWGAPLLALGFINQVLMIWAIIGYAGGALVFWRKWL